MQTCRPYLESCGWMSWEWKKISALDFSSFAILFTFSFDSPSKVENSISSWAKKKRSHCEVCKKGPLRIFIFHSASFIHFLLWTILLIKLEGDKKSWRVGKLLLTTVACEDQNRVSENTKLETIFLLFFSGWEWKCRRKRLSSAFKWHDALEHRQTFIFHSYSAGTSKKMSLLIKIGGGHKWWWWRKKSWNSFVNFS